MYASSENYTLPINTDFGVDYPSTANRLLSFAEIYRAAYPFPHIVLDNFLPVRFIEEVCGEFPQGESVGQTLFNSGYVGHLKRQIPPHSLSRRGKELFHFFNSSGFIGFLEKISGIDGLIGDPYYHGGGFHEIQTGGLLGVHTDFRVNDKLRLQRRMNVLIYLNRDWQVQWGGDLELWSKSGESLVTKISPVYNRCVIFNTDENSYHGHPDPLNTPKGVLRRSLALYYYTASPRIYEDLRSTSTSYKARETDRLGTRIRVFKGNIGNLIRDWCPPFIYRLLMGNRK